MHTVMLFGAALSASAGEEAWFRPACPAVNAFVLTAVTALLYNGLHVALTVAALDAFRRRSWRRALAPVATHVAFALTALLSEAAPTPFAGACVAMLPLLALELAAAAAWAVRVARSRDYAASVQVADWAALAAAAGIGESGAGHHHARSGAPAPAPASVPASPAQVAARPVAHPALAAR